MLETADSIRTSIMQRFANIARCPGEEKRFPVGPESAKRLGYPAVEIDRLPLGVTESFAGVGNPLSLGALHAGQTVLDLGCGAGLDSLLAARRIAPTGLVIGVDMTTEMLDKARRNGQTAGVTNVEFRSGEAESLPVADAIVDVVITNGVLNLCVDKSLVLGEMARVLRPGGDLLMADILLEEHVTPEEVASRGTWSD